MPLKKPPDLKLLSADPPPRPILQLTDDWLGAILNNGKHIEVRGNGVALGNIWLCGHGLIKGFATIVAKEKIKTGGAFEAQRDGRQVTFQLLEPCAAFGTHGAALGSPSALSGLFQMILEKSCAKSITSPTNFITNHLRRQSITPPMTSPINDITSQ